MSRSPYSAPDAPMAVDESERVPGPPLAEIDLAAALKWPSATQDWWKICMIAGLWWMVPVVGWVALTGWARRIHHQVRSGEPGELPALDFGEDLGLGWAPTFATLSTMGVAMGSLLVVFAGFVALTPGLDGGDKEAASMLFAVAFFVTQLAYLGVLLLFNVYLLELSRLSYAGRLFPPAHIGSSVRALRANPGPYAIATLGVFIAGMAMSMGMYLCIPGVLLSFPWGFAVMAHLSGQWARVAESPAAAP